MYPRIVWLVCFLTGLAFLGLLSHADATGGGRRYASTTEAPDQAGLCTRCPHRGDDARCVWRAGYQRLQSRCAL